jgi:hypothetical protein
MLQGVELPCAPGHYAVNQDSQIFYTLAIATIPEMSGDIYKYRNQAMKHSLSHTSLHTKSVFMKNNPWVRRIQIDQ